MKKEKVVISFFAVIIGIIAAGIAFYFYQSTKTLSGQNTKSITVAKPTPTPETSIFLSVDAPVDESVTDKKTITISGKTETDGIIVISTETADEVISPTRTGSFSTTAPITDGTNRIEVTAIAPDGQEATIVRTVSFSAEEF